MISAALECSGDSPTGLERNIIKVEIAILCNDGADIPTDPLLAQKHFEMMSNVSEFDNI